MALEILPAESRPQSNGDSFEVKFKFGGPFIRKAWPYIVASLLAGGGGYAFKTKHDADIAALQNGQARIEGEVKIITDFIFTGKKPRRP